MNTNRMRLWGWPSLLAVLTIVGLCAALLGDGIWDVVSWVALAALLALPWRRARMQRGRAPASKTKQ